MIWSESIGALGGFWPAYFTVLVFLFGSCVGSFLNVCIYRIPQELSVVTPRSHCPSCGQLIAWYDNIPLLSFALLAGRCRHCRNRISPRYVLVESLTAVLFLLVWLKLALAPEHVFGLTPIATATLLPVYWLFIAGLILGTFVDIEHMIIPDRVSIGGIVAGVVLSPLVPAMHGATGRWNSLLMSLDGAALGFALLWTIAGVGRLIFKRDAMGFGDVKLIGAIGAFLGWRAVLFTLMVSSLVGSVIGVVFVIAGRKQMQSRIPYGPYLALAAVLWVLWGSGWWDAYVNWLILARPV